MYLGPIIGSFLYSTGGYFFTFAILALLFFISALIVKLTMPASIDDKDQETKSLMKSENDKNNLPVQIGYCQLVSDPVIIL